MRHLVLGLSCLLFAMNSLAGDIQMWTWCDETSDGEACISDLLSRWESRGPAEFQQLGMQLSKALVVHPGNFFRLMADDKFVFNEWRRTLPEHTLMSFASSDHLEGRLQKAYVETLRQEMLKTCKTMEQDPAHGEMARSIAATLSRSETN